MGVGTFTRGNILGINVIHAFAPCKGIIIYTTILPLQGVWMGVGTFTRGVTPG